MFIKTGTTIVGIKYNDGIVLCADTRSTTDMVSDKNSKKIHKITDAIYACGAGTAADIRRVARMVSKELAIFEKKYNRTPRMAHCIRTATSHLHSYQGHVSAALIVGGVDDTGIHLHDVYPHGSSNSVSYTAVGSGCLAAISILENGYKDLSKEEAIQLGCEAIKAGILNDLYSGSNVDVMVISIDGVEDLRNYMKIGIKADLAPLKYPNTSVKILKEDVFKFVEEVQ